MAIRKCLHIEDTVCSCVRSVFLFLLLIWCSIEHISARAEQQRQSHKINNNNSNVVHQFQLNLPINISSCELVHLSLSLFVSVSLSLLWNCVLRVFVQREFDTVTPFHDTCRWIISLTVYACIFICETYFKNTCGVFLFPLSRMEMPCFSFVYITVLNRFAFRFTRFEWSFECIQFTSAEDIQNALLPFLG